MSKPNPNRMPLSMPNISPGTSRTLRSEADPLDELPRSASAGRPRRTRSRRPRAGRIGAPVGPCSHPSSSGRLARMMPRVRARIRSRRAGSIATAVSRSLEHAWRQGGVVVPLPDPRDHVGGRDRPSDPQTGHPERLRQAARDHDLVVAAPERRATSRRCRPRRRGRSRRRRSRRRPCAATSITASISASVRTAPVGLFGLQTITTFVAGPTARSSDSRSSAHRSPSRARRNVSTRVGEHRAEPERLAVVRDHEGEPVAGLEQRPEGEQVRLGAAVHHRDVVGGRLGVPLGDRRPRLVRALGQRVAERGVDERRRRRIRAARRSSSARRRIPTGRSRRGASRAIGTAPSRTARSSCAHASAHGAVVLKPAG